MKSDKKFVFFDIDGTLLNANKEVAASTLTALHELKCAGHQIFVCTGRTKCMLPKVITDIDFDGYVYGGGTALEYESQMLLLEELNYDQIVQVAELLKKYNCAYVFEGNENVYMENRFFHDERSYYRNFMRSLGEVCIGFDSYDEIKASKATCIFPDDMPVEDKKLLVEKLMSEYQCILHERVDNGIMTDGLVEVLPKDFTKGTGIERMSEKLGISISQTVGVGDSNNDLEMLKVVGTAICMGNGTEQAKNLADFITKGVNENGILYAMTTLGYI